MYVITHRSEIDSAFDRKMTIQMIKKFSYVKVESIVLGGPRSWNNTRVVVPCTSKLKKVKTQGLGG